MWLLGWGARNLVLYPEELGGRVDATTNLEQLFGRTMRPVSRTRCKGEDPSRVAQAPIPPVVELFRLIPPAVLQG